MENQNYNSNPTKIKQVSGNTRKESLNPNTPAINNLPKMAGNVLSKEGFKLTDEIVTKILDENKSIDIGLTPVSWVESKTYNVGSDTLTMIQPIVGYETSTALKERNQKRAQAIKDYKLQLSMFSSINPIAGFE